jgi:acetylornithine aminotransferase
MQGLRALCDARGWLLMLDEVQCGNGRAGHYFACQGMGVVPDVITTAKGLGNGVPIGACLAHGPAATVFRAGHHGSTYGGNPLACAAGLAVVNTVVNEGLAERATAAGTHLRQRLETALQGCDNLVEIRGRGLMIGVQLHRECGDLVQRALAAGLLINVTAGDTIRLLPPLICSDAQLDELAAGLNTLIRDFD